MNWIALIALGEFGRITSGISQLRPNIC